MPYYIYKITEHVQLEYLDQKTNFQAAKEMVKKLRQEQFTHDNIIIRMIFAESTGAAERLLSVPKEPQVIGED